MSMIQLPIGFLSRETSRLKEIERRIALLSETYNCNYDELIRLVAEYEELERSAVYKILWALPNLSGQKPLSVSAAIKNRPDRN